MKLILVVTVFTVVREEVRTKLLHRWQFTGCVSLVSVNSRNFTLLSPKIKIRMSTQCVSNGVRPDQLVLRMKLPPCNDSALAQSCFDSSITSSNDPKDKTLVKHLFKRSIPERLLAVRVMECRQSSDRSDSKQDPSQ